MAEHPTACEAWQPALAGWLVADITPEEEAALEVHLATCAACRAEADSLLAVAAVSLGADPSRCDAPLAAPPADLRERTLARVRRERRARQAGRLAMAMAAAAAAVLAAVVLVDGDDGPGQLQGEPIEFAVVPAGADASAVVADDGGGSAVQLTASGLEPDVTYALWLTPAGGGYADRVPAGTFRADADGAVDARLHSALAASEAARVWATTPDGQVALDTTSD
jgi:predicted anti-sigma-YlaC factor YlaD